MPVDSVRANSKVDAVARIVVVAGATGDLGRRIAIALVRRNVSVRALVRAGTAADRRAALQAIGVEPVAVDFDDVAGLEAACAGAECVVSAVNGVAPTILGLQGRLLDAAVAAGVARFIPSDFALDFTKTVPGDNRNLDLRRAFMARLDQAPIRATSILNGGFADLLTGGAPLLLHKARRVLYWGDIGQQLDFTTKDDVADFTADAALDAQAPRLLRIAGDTVGPRDLARVMSELNGRPWKPFRIAGTGLLGGLIKVIRRLTPASDSPFPAWQGMQYLRDMSIGRGRLVPLDNARYGKQDWMRVRDVLSATR